MWPSVKTSILAFLTFHLLPLSAQHLQVLSTTVIVGRSSGTPALFYVNDCYHVQSVEIHNEFKVVNTIKNNEIWTLICPDSICDKYSTHSTPCIYKGKTYDFHTITYEMYLEKSTGIGVASSGITWRKWTSKYRETIWSKSNNEILFIEEIRLCND